LTYIDKVLVLVAGKQMRQILMLLSTVKAKDKLSCFSVTFRTSGQHPTRQVSYISK